MALGRSNIVQPARTASRCRKFSLRRAMNSGNFVAAKPQSRLHICGFQVVADMGIRVLVIVSARQRTQLPIETLAAGVVFAGLAPAVAAPVAKGLNQGLQRRLVGENSSAFTSVMWCAG